MKIVYGENTFDKDKLMRCETCRILLTPKMIRDGECAGHYMKIAHHITLWEWILWKLNRLR